MQVGDLVWARWADKCMGVVIDIIFDETDVEYSYRVKWFWSRTFESREYIEDLITKEEKCLKQEI